MIEPCTYETITGSDARQGSGFGIAVAMRGNLAVVGAVAQGGHGAGYILRRNAFAWTEEAAVVGSNIDAGDLFGWSVATDGHRVVVASPYADELHGAAYVYRSEDTGWVEEATLQADDGLPGGDHLAWSVSIDGNVIVVGAPFDSQGAPHAGAAYVFQYDGTQWLQAQKIFGQRPAANAYFGVALALAGDRLAIGTQEPPAIDVYQRTGQFWVWQDQLTAPGASIGVTIAMDDNLLASTDWANQTILVFSDSKGSWTLQSTLAAPDAGPDDGFGRALAISGNRILAGAPLHSHGNLTEGAAYLFVHDGLDWQQVEVADPQPDQVGTWDEFGGAVAIEGDLALIGATHEGAEPPAGAAYAYVLAPDCNGNGVIDCGDGADCNGNGFLDECDIADGTSQDVYHTGIPDECECAVDICVEPRLDCNCNGVLDGCEIAYGTSKDFNGNGVPDDCECFSDCQAVPDGTVGISDLLALLAQWGLPTPCDFDGGGVGMTDLLGLLARWGPCP